MGAEDGMLRQEWTSLHSTEFGNGSFVGNPHVSRFLSTSVSNHYPLLASEHSEDSKMSTAYSHT